MSLPEPTGTNITEDFTLSFGKLNLATGPEETVAVLPDLLMSSEPLTVELRVVSTTRADVASGGSPARSTVRASPGCNGPPEATES